MKIEELYEKEQVLRKEFKDRLKHLDCDGDNDLNFIKDLKMYGALWHYTNQLIKAETEQQIVVKHI